MTKYFCFKIVWLWAVSEKHITETEPATLSFVLYVGASCEAVPFQSDTRIAFTRREPSVQKELFEITAGYRKDIRNSHHSNHKRERRRTLAEREIEVEKEEGKTKKKKRRERRERAPCNRVTE